MNHYAGIDVSLECSSLCVVEANGNISREAKVASEPAALIAWFRSSGFGVSNSMWPRWARSKIGSGVIKGLSRRWGNGPGLPSKQSALATALLMARYARLAWMAVVPHMDGVTESEG